MCSHGLRQLVDDKSVASCQQTCYKLIVKTCYQQACYKLFQQVVTSLQMTSCNKPDFNRFAGFLQYVHKLQAGKTDDLQQVTGVFGRVKDIIFYSLANYSVINPLSWKLKACLHALAIFAATSRAMTNVKY